jgi:iron complex outermembrane receptor protein
LKKNISFVLLFSGLAVSNLFAQTGTKPDTVEMETVVITASRINEKIADIPGRVSVITKSEISNAPASNLDDLLHQVANVNVNRSWGIFSKNASVTMRGLEGANRTLVMLDGIPLNKSSGGTINWHLIPGDDIQKIEVVKGPVSAVYGNNAMGGAINLLTGKPDSALEVRAKLSYASYNTKGISATAGGFGLPFSKKMYWNVYGFSRQGDGYVIEPRETRDSTSSKAYLEESGMGIKTGYQQNANNSLEMSYLFFNDKRGSGTKVYESDGSYDRYISNIVKLTWQAGNANTHFNTSLFYYGEHYLKQSENINATGDYKLSETDSRNNEKGLMFNVNQRISSSNSLLAGVDVKLSDMDGTDTYKTSTDILDYEGKMNFYGFYLQDEMSFLSGKGRFVAGMRFDNAEFSNGSLKVTDPTSNTGFTKSYQDKFRSDSWQSFSPKLALQYLIHPKLKTYVSWAEGFMPPKLDDLCRSGKITKGFKLANPELKPEVLSNVEWGMDYRVWKGFVANLSLYHSIGNDFQYFIPTGDSVDTGGGTLKPVLRRENVGTVEINGIELSAQQEVGKAMTFSASYAYNHSDIKKFNIKDNPSGNLEGKYLVEVPDHQGSASVQWKSRFLTAFFLWEYTGKQWFDEENTISLSDHSLFDLKISKNIAKNFRLSFTAQNLFDTEIIDKKGRLSPGRFISVELLYQLKK